MHGEDGRQSENTPNCQGTPPTTSGPAERHYSVSEIASLWGMSKDTVRRLFCNEPGVLKLDNRARGTKRRYTTLRIPQSVLERVHRRLSFV